MLQLTLYPGPNETVLRCEIVEIQDARGRMTIYSRQFDYSKPVPRQHVSTTPPGIRLVHLLLSERVLAGGF